MFVRSSKRRRWARWLRWGRVLNKINNKFPYMLQFFPAVSVIPRHRKSTKSWLVNDFGKLIEGVERCKPHYKKLIVVIENPRHKDRG